MYLYSLQIKGVKKSMAMPCKILAPYWVASYRLTVLDALITVRYGMFLCDMAVIPIKRIAA
jgi:hypothetical protein